MRPPFAAVFPMNCRRLPDLRENFAAEIVRNGACTSGGNHAAVTPD